MSRVTAIMNADDMLGEQMLLFFSLSVCFCYITTAIFAVNMCNS